MANVSRPEGFRPKGEALRENKYYAAGIVYPGDMVTLDANGQAAVAAASTALLGASNSYAAAQGDPIMVWDHPDQLFTAQADDATIDAQTDFNLNYDLLATAGNASYRVSRQQIDASTQATTATLPLKVLGLEEKPDNALGAQAKCICKINNHQLSGGTGTAGI